MKYLDQIEKALKIIKYEPTKNDLSSDELEQLLTKINKYDNYFDKLEILYTEAGVDYLYLVTNDENSNPFIAYQLGEYYENHRVTVENKSIQKIVAQYALDCLVYAYRNGIEDAFDLLIICLLFYCDINVRFYLNMKDKEFLQLIETLEPIIEEEKNTTYKILLNKRIGDYYYREANISYDIYNKDNWKYSYELFRFYIKALKGYHFDAIEKIKEMLKWPSLNLIAEKKENYYRICDTYKIEYQFIEDEVCNEAFEYFNLENYHECDLAYDSLLHLNNKNVFYNYALFLKHGYYEENKEEALKYFKKAYELGEVKASYHIADLANDIDFANIAIENNILGGYLIKLRLVEDRELVRSEYNRKVVEYYENRR